jgi:hypothetical protein
VVSSLTAKARAFPATYIFHDSEARLEAAANADLPVFPDAAWRTLRLQLFLPNEIIITGITGLAGAYRSGSVYLAADPYLDWL